MLTLDKYPEYITRSGLMNTSIVARDVVMEAWRYDLRPTPKKEFLKRIEAVFKRMLAEEDWIAMRKSVRGDLLKVVFGDVHE